MDLQSLALRITNQVHFLALKHYQIETFLMKLKQKKT